MLGFWARIKLAAIIGFSAGAVVATYNLSYFAGAFFVALGVTVAIYVAGFAVAFAIYCLVSSAILMIGLQFGEVGFIVGSIVWWIYTVAVVREIYRALQRRNA